MKISRQLTLLIVIVIAGFSALGAYGLMSLRSSLIDQTRHEIQTVLTFARNQAMIYVRQEQQGTLSREEAEKRVVELLSGMREGSSYIWSNDNNAIARVHPRAEKLGQFQDSYAGHMQALRNQEFTFVVEQNKKPGENRTVTKVNGVTRIPEWNWVTGLGAYMDDVNAVYWNFALKFMLISAVILALVVLVAVGMIRHILGRLGGELNYAVDVTRKIAAGDLSETVRGNFAATSLLGAIQTMQQSLKSMMDQVAGSTRQLKSASSSLSQEFSHITGASSESSSASHSTAAAIQQLSVSIEGIAERSQTTEQNSEKAASLCRDGETMVNSSGTIIKGIADLIGASVRDFESLQKRSDEIGNVVNVISEIAEQTNLLALNAAIEAARAGEQGRGFAVVADEVRTLASRTATATAEITETIKVIQQETNSVAGAIQSLLPQVQQSVRHSEDLNAMLADIQGSSAETSSMVRDISMSTSEQRLASEELARHVERISDRVQSTAEAIASCNRTVSELDNMADELNRSMSYFRVSGS